MLTPSKTTSVVLWDSFSILVNWMNSHFNIFVCLGISGQLFSCLCRNLNWLTFFCLLWFRSSSYRKLCQKILSRYSISVNGALSHEHALHWFQNVSHHDKQDETKIQMCFHMFPALHLRQRSTNRVKLWKVLNPSEMSNIGHYNGT